MQNELSDISKQTVRDAAAELQNASQRESNLAQQLENSDAQTMDSKAVQAQQLKALAQNAENLAASVLNKAQTPIQRINQQELRKDVAAVSNALVNAARQAQSADPNASQKSLQEKTDQLVKEVQKAQQQLGAMNPNLNQLVDQNNFKEDKQRQAQLTEAQSSQSLMRDDQIRQTKDMSRRREQLANQLAKESENRDKELQQKNNERNKTLEALQKRTQDCRHRWIRKPEKLSKRCSEPTPQNNLLKLLRRSPTTPSNRSSGPNKPNVRTWTLLIRWPL
jgi:hypothetical protein